MLKCALTGAGNIVRTSHLPCLLKTGKVEVVAVCDVDKGSAEKLASEFDIPHFYSNFDQMLEECNPDFVTIGVPNKFHSPYAIKALEHGADVFCEKPPAVSYEDALRMEETAKKHGKILSYGFQNRFSAPFQFASKLISEGKVGKIYHVRTSWLRRRGIPGWGCFTDRNMQGGGPLVDIGVHMLDMAFALLGYPEIYYCSATWSNAIGKNGGEGDFGPWSGDRFSVEDALFGMIVFKDGTSLSIDTSFALNIAGANEKLLDLFSDRVGISFFPPTVNDGYTSKIEDIPEVDARLLMIKDFVSAVEEHREPVITATQGTYVQRAVSMLYESAENGKPVYCR